MQEEMGSTVVQYHCGAGKASGACGGMLVGECPLGLIHPRAGAAVVKQELQELSGSNCPLIKARGGRGAGVGGCGSLALAAALTPVCVCVCVYIISVIIVRKMLEL